MIRTEVTKYIANNTKVWCRYAIEIGDNGESGDARVSLHIAPEVGGNEVEWLYLETNGDPVPVGWLDGDEVEFCDDSANWLDQEPWVQEAIDVEI